MSYLETPLDAVIFDCDATLSSIEGINELAKISMHAEQVRKLTSQAMQHQGVISPELYEERLQLVQPTLSDCQQLGKSYWQHRTKNIESVIAKLHQLGKAVFVVSGGLTQSITSFTRQLNISSERSMAVDLYFNDAGEYEGFDFDNVLCTNAGKGIIAEKIKQQYPRLGYVGDGFNDVSAIPVVKRFIGFGAHFFREEMQAVSDFYITQNDALVLLPFLLTKHEHEHMHSLPAAHS